MFWSRSTGSIVILLLLHVLRLIYDSMLSNKGELGAKKGNSRQILRVGVLTLNVL